MSRTEPTRNIPPCTGVLRGGQQDLSRGHFLPSCSWAIECKAQRRCFWRWYDELTDRELYALSAPIATPRDAGPAPTQGALFA